MSESSIKRMLYQSSSEAFDVLCKFQEWNLCNTILGLNDRNIETVKANYLHLRKVLIPRLTGFSPRWVAVWN